MLTFGFHTPRRAPAATHDERETGTFGFGLIGGRYFQGRARTHRTVRVQPKPREEAFRRRSGGFSRSARGEDPVTVDSSAFRN